MRSVQVRMDVFKLQLKQFALQKRLYIIIELRIVIMAIPNFQDSRKFVMVTSLDDSIKTPPYS